MYTQNQVKFRVYLEQDHTPVRGNALASGNAACDKEVEDEIIARLARGDIKAWCTLKVVAIAPDGIMGHDSLDCVSMASDRDPEEYARDNCMFNIALEDLNAQLKPPQIKTVRMCITHYIGPTNHKPGRVAAKHCTTGKRVVVKWDHALDMFENHALAAERVLGARPEFACSIDGGGYVFGVDPANLLPDPSAVLQPKE